MDQPRFPVLYQMAKAADMVVERTAPPRCTLLLAAVLTLSILINIILGCLYGDAGCAVDEVIEAQDTNVALPEKTISHTHSNVGLVIDASKEGNECDCLSPSWQILEILVLTALLTFALNYGARATWKARSWWNAWRRDIKDKRKQKVLHELMAAEQELSRSSALRNAREIQV